jgi:hypothetical protein
MAEYRVFFQRQGGRLERGEAFQAADDAAAVAIVSATPPSATFVELWQGGRQVRTFDPREAGGLRGPRRDA